MSKKPTRKTPYSPARDAPPPDEDEPMELEEETTMDDEPKTPEGEPKHPDPEGKMRSHAPGYTTGPEGESKELPKEKEE